ncbi:cell division FtsA domain-containing protein [Candidatus Giovannonibacteria bacterium]|nr:cell division FtsA domain-containing protein [Candidatus Giovannonibacteria bacterium]
MLNFLTSRTSFAGTKLLAIDVGTASLSAVLAAEEHGGKLKISKVFRFPFNLLIEGPKKQSANAVLSNLKKVFAEAARAEPEVKKILISFSDPLVSERALRHIVERKPPFTPISESEIKFAIDEAAGKLSSENPSLVAAKKEILGASVNGYAVTSPVNYRGKFFGINVLFTFISELLKKQADEAREHFYPAAGLCFFSDARVVFNTLKGTQNLSEPLVLADIGGEVTSVFHVSGDELRQAEPVAFGVRTLERRASVFFKTDFSEAESILKKHLAGTLDTALEEKAARFLDSALEDWRVELKKHIDFFGEKTKKIMLTGGGGDLLVFTDAVKKEFGAVMPETGIQSLKAEALKDHFVSLENLSGGKDVILASLLSYCRDIC